MAWQVSFACQSSQPFIYTHKRLEFDTKAEADIDDGVGAFKTILSHL